MKKLPLCLISITLFFAACSPALYQQIATLSSESVELKDDGSYKYEDAMIMIEYDFWSEAGKFNFTITNNTDDNIYLNLDSSYFVNNGYAYDYYQARTYVYTSRNVDARKLSSSLSSASENGTSVEYREQPAVCIPAHTAKKFEEFEVSSAVFRECGFVRAPSGKETSVREFSSYNSPVIIENRLSFRIGSITVPVNNVFYVNEYRNISVDNEMKYDKVENCNGTKKSIKVNKFSASNRFYVTYVPDTDDSTDRKSFGDLY